MCRSLIILLWTEQMSKNYALYPTHFAHSQQKF